MKHCISPDVCSHAAGLIQQGDSRHAVVVKCAKCFCGSRVEHHADNRTHKTQISHAPVVNDVQIACKESHNVALRNHVSQLLVVPNRHSVNSFLPH